jgi:hypothetical protein
MTCRDSANWIKSALPELTAFRLLGERKARLGGATGKPVRGAIKPQLLCGEDPKAAEMSNNLSVAANEKLYLTFTARHISIRRGESFLAAAKVEARYATRDEI